MAKPSTVGEPGKPQPARWPFDPLQPGDHEPAELPQELERVQKQTGGGHDAQKKEPKP